MMNINAYKNGSLGYLPVYFFRFSPSFFFQVFNNSLPRPMIYYCITRFWCSLALCFLLGILHFLPLFLSFQLTI
jgi:hypothetical protein